jgi:EAL domain-containing protein (putative c-di-GMP-specific phosphodiesterase class I)
MHQAKPGRGGYAVYSGGQEQEYTRRLGLMGDLHGALKHNELQLYCQPKVDIASRRVSGAEALVRWQHPQHGIILPSEFILLAEQAGMITPLTNWMMAAAFSQSYAWQEAGFERSLAVNLSAHDLYDPGLIDRIRGLFSTWGVSPALIQFELTESALMADREAALDTLARLKKLNVDLFIDDFGTGYSSLSYLQQLPVDAIKIDQSFVMPMNVSADSGVIVRSTIELGHNLGLKVVAEGVESQPLWDRLAMLGCDVAQGYLIGMPMPADQFQFWESNWAHPASGAE